MSTQFKQDVMHWNRQTGLTGFALAGLLLITGYYPLAAQEKTELHRQLLEPSKIHLRVGANKEWARFPNRAFGSSWTTEFSVDHSKLKTLKECTLTVRQVDVRRNWEVNLNGKKLGILKKDQNDLVHHFEVPAELLKTTGNQVSVRGMDEKNADDIFVGPIWLFFGPPEKLYRESGLSVTVKDLKNQGKKLPCRITILDSNNSLIGLHVEPNHKVAMREGVVYTRDGQVDVRLPAGKYRVFANRGFEYSQASQMVEIMPGETKAIDLGIQRAVDTEGWIACDTHVHTVTHSGHGDCSVSERMITLAGEGVELPIATDHNKQIDYQPIVQSTRTGSFFTPVIGNEVTTDFGHFNAFPLPSGSPLPNHRENDWNVLLPSLYKLGAKVVILNHGRDIHRGYRPLDAANFNETSGQSLNGRPFLFNAMEVINSAAQQTDQYQLFRDWMAMVNGGHKIVPIGSSDSHDVNAFIVGQGRTYIRSDDFHPGKINVENALKNLAAGKIMVSCGLIGKIRINEKYESGDLVKNGGELEVVGQMAGPGWLRGTRMQLYENGKMLQEKVFDLEPVSGSDSEGFMRKAKFHLGKRTHDTFLVLLVRGPGFLHPSWTLAQPYQPTGPAWKPEVFGFTGAVYIDGDGDGKFTSAREYARLLLEKNQGNFEALIKDLKEYDESVSVQVADLYHANRGDLMKREFRKSWEGGSPNVRAGFSAFLRSWQKSERARILK